MLRTFYMCAYNIRDMNVQICRTNHKHRIVSVLETCFHNIGIIDFPPAVVLGHSNCVRVIRDAGCVTGSAAGQMNRTDVQ